MSTPGDADPAFTSAMRELSRSHIADIWRRGQQGESLGSEDAPFYQAMLDHPEYRDIWEHAAELGDREVVVQGANPFLHISLHSVVERQLADNNPPETAQALFRLTRGGMDRHEAIHLIASLLSELVWETLHKRQPADVASYRRRLRALKP
jgi:hypothetical protein